MKIFTLNDYIKVTYGHKMYKVSLDGGFTCPNRDGSISTGGCIFCLDGSGSFASDRSLSITEQIEKGKLLISRKFSADNVNHSEEPSYIAYFQSYTGTYGDIDRLRQLYMEAVSNPDIAILSIATRPDCLGQDVCELLWEINQIKPVWIELGLQTIHENTSTIINRGYSLDVYDTAVDRLNSLGIKVITHMIIGLPGESKEQIVETARYIGQTGAWGIKFQLLHILENTQLSEMYYRGEVTPLTLDEYGDILVECIKAIPPSMVIHRITGDGDKKHMLAPLWSGDKKHVLGYLNKLLAGASL